MLKLALSKGSNWVGTSIPDDGKQSTSQNTVENPGGWIMSSIKTKCTLGYQVCGLTMHDHKLLPMTNDKGGK